MFKEQVIMSMPKRPKQHQAEDLSIIAFQKLLPREWVYREKDKDYGVDGEVEIFEDDGTATGVVFYVQLKATDSQDEKTQKRVKLKNSAINYYKALELPTLIIRYIIETEEIYFKWAHSIDRYKHKKSEETFSFVVTDDNLWKNETAENIHNFLIRLTILKTKNNLFPIKVYFNFSFSEICSYKPYSLKSKLRTDLADKNKYFQMVSEEKDCEFKINVSDSEISVFILGGVTGSYLHSIDDISYENIDELISDIFVAISLALLSFNKNFNAFNVIDLFARKSQYLKNPNACIHFTELCFSMGEIEKANELWNNVSEENKDDVLRMKFQLQSIMAAKNFDDKDVEVYEQYLLQQINENKEQGTLYYNYANFLHNQGRLREAFSNYRKAFKYEQEYQEAKHIYKEVAGTLFELKRYKLASYCYKKALGIEYEAQVEVLYADSLMMNGQFLLARESFRNYFKNTETIDDEWILKDAVLEYIINEYKIESQVRQSNLASKQNICVQCNDETASVEDLQKVIQIDALASSVWFNLGIIYSRNNDWENAMASYLLCSLIKRDDVEGWINSYKSAFNVNNMEFSILILKVGYHINGEVFIQEIYSLLEEMSKTVPEEIIGKMFELVEMLVDSSKRNEISKEPTVRMFNGENFIDVNKDSKLDGEEVNE